MRTRDLMSVSQVARRLGVAEQTVRSYDERGVLPAYRMASGARVWMRQDVERLVQQRAQGSPAPTLPREQAHA